MKSAILSLVLLIALFEFGQSSPIHKRAAFYIANETACVVDSLVYMNGDPIPTDDPCEACKCRPPGFACVLKDCPKKPGCRAVRKIGECCPEYVCGCEHNGRMYRDGDEIRDSKNPCYTCHCQGSSIACAFVDCFFRVDCAPEYVQDKCCPEYNHCNHSSVGEDNALTTPEAVINTLVIEDILRITPPAQSSVEYVEPENKTGNEDLQEEPAKVEINDAKSANNAGVIHRIDITVDGIYDNEKSYSDVSTTTEAITSYEASSQSIEETVSEDSSIISDSNEESEGRVANEDKLLNTEELKISFPEASDEKNISPTENVFSSTTIDILEANSELFATTESQVKDEASSVSEVTELESQTDVPVATEHALENEVIKETNEIKRFRSLYDNETGDSLVTESTGIRNDWNTTDIKDELKENAVKEQIDSNESDFQSDIKDQSEKTVTATETSPPSYISEDKIADFLISLKKTSTNIPTTDATVSTSVSTTLDTKFENAGENVTELATSVATDGTTVVEEQKISSTVVSNEDELALGRASIDLINSNENQDNIQAGTSTSQAEIVQSSNGTDAPSSSFQTTTPTAEQSTGTQSYNSEPATESYTSTENEKNGTLNEKIN